MAWKRKTPAKCRKSHHSPTIPCHTSFSSWKLGCINLIGMYGMQDNHPILIKFPENKSAILHLSNQHAAFVDTCDDYRLICEEIEVSGDGVRVPNDPTLVELLRLQGELEEEVKQWLKDADDECTAH